MNVGWLWPPRHTARRPVSLLTLGKLLEAEHRQVRTFFEGKDEGVLGNVRLYDPPIGRLNMIQALRVGVYHDAHHFRVVEQMLQKQGLHPGGGGSEAVD